MRLTCPNCGAEYDVPEEMIPPAGKHVQCSACHTRWFVRGARPSEEQILQRLENITPRPKPVLVPVSPLPISPQPVSPLSVSPLSVSPLSVSPPPASPAAAQTDPEFSWESPRAGPQPESPPAEERAGADPDRPEAPEQALLRSAPRLELSPRDPVEALPPSPPPGRGRYGRGLAAALLLAALAVAAYVWRDGIAASVPAAAPILQAYGGVIDGARNWLDQLGH